MDSDSVKSSLWPNFTVIADQNVFFDLTYRDRQFIHCVINCVGLEALFFSEFE